jgi:hypothetical protein
MVDESAEIEMDRLAIPFKMKDSHRTQSETPNRGVLKAHNPKFTDRKQKSDHEFHF